MRLLPLACCLALGAPVFAASIPPQQFPDQSIGVPSLSLLDGTRSGPLPALRGARTFFPAPAPVAETRPPALVSRMPVLEPRSDVEPRLRVKQPDDRVDHKMAVKAPAVVSAADR